LPEKIQLNLELNLVNHSLQQNCYINSMWLL